MPSSLQHHRASALLDKASKALKAEHPHWEATRRALAIALTQLVLTRGDYVRTQTNSGWEIFEALVKFGLAAPGPRAGTFAATAVGLGYRPTDEEREQARDVLGDRYGRVEGRVGRAAASALTWRRAKRSLGLPTTFHAIGPSWWKEATSDYWVAQASRDDDRTESRLDLVVGEYLKEKGRLLSKHEYALAVGWRRKPPVDTKTGLYDWLVVGIVSGIPSLAEAKRLAAEIESLTVRTVSSDSRWRTGERDEIDLGVPAAAAMRKLGLLQETSRHAHR